MTVTISVIMPCFNEEGSLERNASTVTRYLDSFGKSYELILVNDGSTDNTAKIINTLAKANKHIIACHHKKNRGRGAGLRTGFETSSGEYVFTFDPDLSYTIDHIEPMYKKLQECDVVLASAYHKKGKVTNVPYFRALVSKMGNKVLTLGSDINTVTCVVRGYRQEVLESIELFSNGKDIHLEIISKVSDAGFTIKEIPAHLKWNKQKKGQKRRSTFKIITHSLSHLQHLFTETPFIILGSLASLLILVGIAIGGFLVNEWINHQLVPDRPLVTIMIIFLIAGLQVLLFSLIAQQNRSLRRELIHTQTMIKKRLKRYY